MTSTLAAGGYAATTAADGGVLSYAWLIALPLPGAAVLLLGGRRTDAWGTGLPSRRALRFAGGPELRTAVRPRSGRAQSSQYTSTVDPGRHTSKSTSGLQIDPLSIRSYC